MGQNISLDRPKISFTWVLREQKNQTLLAKKKTNSWTGKNSKKIFSKISKPEKLFSEKYVSKNVSSNLANHKKVKIEMI
jgi:hypothetical protein